MVDRFIYSFYKNSLVNTIDYLSLTKDEKKHETSAYFYTIIIDNIPVTSPITSLLSDESEGFTYKKISIKTSQSLDGEHTKTNGVIKSVKKIFTTEEKLVLQKHISLFGYMSEEKDVKKESSNQVNWGDMDDDQMTMEKQVKMKEKEKVKEKVNTLLFGPETIETVDFFSKKDISVYVTLSKIKIVFSMNDDMTDENFMMNFLHFILYRIYFDYRYILTLDTEVNVRNSPIVKQIKSILGENYFPYKYVSVKKDISVVVKNFYRSIPCVIFTINHEIFILDVYNNLKKVNESLTDNNEPYFEQGFVDAYTLEFTDLTNPVYNTLKNDNDALVYATKILINNIPIYQFEIHTKINNIYVDKIISNVFTRSFFTKKRPVMPFFLSVCKTMAPQKVREIESFLIDKKVTKIITRFCSDLDVEYLEKISQVLKDAIVQKCKKMNGWLPAFLVSLITLKYDENNPIIINLNETVNDHQSDRIVSKKPLHLDTLLQLEKDKIDTFGSDEKRAKYYSEVMKLLDRLKVYSKDVEKRVPVKGSITNSWMRCWEMCHTFDLIPKNHSDKFTVFCNGELPGAFVLALNHYIKTETSQKKFEWYANSLLLDKETQKTDNVYKDKEIFTDFFKLYEKYPNRWLMSKEEACNGDITKPEMRETIRQKLENKVDLYTGDISLGTESNEETVEAPYQLSQIICGLQCLKNGGTMVCRMYSFFKAFTISLLRVLCNVFTAFYITKPMASRPSSSEIYIVGKGYKRDDASDALIDRLIEILSNWNTDTINQYFEPVTEDFYLKLVYCSFYIYQRQLFYLEKNMDCVEELYRISRNPKDISEKMIRQTIEKEHFDFRQEVVDEWKSKFPVSNLAKEFGL
jgi:hypothetical protein